MKRLLAARWFFGCLALLLVAGCLTHPDLRPGRTRFRTARSLIPAQIIGNHFLVTAKWDKRGPWNFLIDTGSSVTLVTPEFARRYANEKPAFDAPTVRIKGADGTSSLLAAVTLRRLDLGAVRFDNVQALIGDLSEISDHLGVKIDGVLGFPLFRETLVTLDYPANQLVLEPSETVSAPAGATIKFNNDQRTPLIPVRLGATTLIMLIDSGSDGPFELNPAGLDLTYATPPRTGTTIGTLNGDRSQNIGRLGQSLEIGRYEFRTPIVDVTDQLSSLGGEILRNFAVTFDQARNQVTFSRSEAGPITMPPRRVTGMAFSKGPTYWRVVSLVPGSPAAETGVQVGDLVTRINGESISEWPVSRFDPYVKRNTEIVFTFLDGAKERPMVIPTFTVVP